MPEKFNLDNDQKKVLELIAERNGKWNWYQFSRAWLNYGCPSKIELCELIKLGVLKEVPCDGEPLPKLLVTDLGLKMISYSR